jgi:H+/gluconate symporter-like permease
MDWALFALGILTPEKAPLIAAIAGVATVLGLMIILRCNAFIALVLAALVVAIVGGVGGLNPMSLVAKSLGSTAGDLAIVVAMAAIIGKCMLESGSAESIVNAAVKVTGEKKAPWGLVVSGFVLAVPVFFDTVFYLLVPLARSLYQKTRKNYLLYVMAIACGGAITHTLVPPTPGPLLVAATLGVDVGSVMLIGLLIAAPSATVGLMFCYFCNRRIEIPLRPLAGVRVDSPENDAEDAQRGAIPPRHVPLGLAIAPVLLPVLMITASTIATTLADGEDLAQLSASDITDPQALATTIQQQAAQSERSPGGRIMASSRLNDARRSTLAGTPSAEQLADALNRAMLDSKLYDSSAFHDVAVDDSLRNQLLSDHLRTKPVDMRHLNRQLLEVAYPQYIRVHQWDSPRRVLSDRLTGIGNASTALTVAAFVAIVTLAWAKRRSLTALAGDVEEALTSGGLIILITSAGGAFGAMLQKIGIDATIKSMLDLQGSGGVAVMLLGAGIACLLKIAQGSSTVAMIIGSSMVAAIVGELDVLSYNPAYLVSAIGAGSLIGSWMNDSGFWVYAKMGGLTEGESLRTWTPLLAVLGGSALAFSLLFSILLPLR